MTKTEKRSGIYVTLLLCLTFLMLLSISGCNSVQESSTTQRLDSLFNELYKNNQFNGAVLVAEKGKPIYEIALGYADTARHPLQLNSQFALAQVTRQFTTMAMMILHEQGKINYSDKVQKYIPGFPYPDVTLYHLMTFTDGMPYIGDLEDQYWDKEKRKTATNADVIQLLLTHTPKASTPGEKLGWAGTNSIITAYIIEEVSGESYPDFLDKHIFQPLNMEHTLVYAVGSDTAKLKNRAHVIKWAVNGKELLTDDVPEAGIMGDVGIYSNLSDLLKWDRALYTEKLVKKETLQQAFIPAKLEDGTMAEDDASRIPGLSSIGKYHFGFGWDLDTLFSSRTVFHGIFPPDGGVMFRNLDKDRTIILLTNNSTQNSRFYHFKIFDRVLKIMNGLPTEPLKKSPADKTGKVLLDKGIAEAKATYHQLKKTEMDAYNFNDPMELFNLGNELLTEGKTEEALAMLQLNSEAFPDHPYTNYLLARIYMMKEDYPEAKTTVEKVLKVYPDAGPAKQMLKMIETKMDGKANK